MSVDPSRSSEAEIAQLQAQRRAEISKLKTKMFWSEDKNEIGSQSGENQSSQDLARCRQRQSLDGREVQKNDEERDQAWSSLT